MEPALSIPEIRQHLCLFIHPQDYKSCALVSRAWFESINPWILHSFTLDRFRSMHFAIFDKYGAYVRVLYLGGRTLTNETYHLFNHLQTLHFSRHEFDPYSRQSMEELIRRNQSSLRSIHVDDISNFRPGPDNRSIILGALVKLSSLKHLNYRSLTLRETAMMESFMNICTRLVTLSLYHIIFVEDTHLMLKGQLFTNLEQLKIQHVHGPCLDFLRACPNLKVLSINELNDTNAEEFVEVIITHCKQLSVLNCYHNGFDHVGLFEKLALILPPMKCLQLLFMCEPIPKLSFSYSRHYETLQAINIRYVLLNDGEGSQTILSSCPSLRWFYGDFIFAEDIESGSPWVCQKLKHLQLDILVRNDDRRLDSVACAQLSQLKNLSSLNLAMPGHEDRKVYQHRSLSLRLGEGLELLASLSKLEHFGVGYLRPEWREDWRTEDIEWMIQAWPNLVAIYGLHGRQDEIHAGLCTHFGAFRVRRHFPSTDYMDSIDL